MSNNDKKTNRNLIHLKKIQNASIKTIIERTISRSIRPLYLAAGRGQTEARQNPKTADDGRQEPILGAAKSRAENTSQSSLGHSVNCPPRHCPFSLVDNPQIGEASISVKVQGRFRGGRWEDSVCLAAEKRGFCACLVRCIACNSWYGSADSVIFFF